MVMMPCNIEEPDNYVFDLNDVCHMGMFWILNLDAIGGLQLKVSCLHKHIIKKLQKCSSIGCVSSVTIMAVQYFPPQSLYLPCMITMCYFIRLIVTVMTVGHGLGQSCLRMIIIS